MNTQTEADIRLRIDALLVEAQAIVDDKLWRYPAEDYTPPVEEGSAEDEP